MRGSSCSAQRRHCSPSLPSFHSLSSFLHAPHDDDDDDGPDCVSSAHPVALYEKKLKKENRADADFSAEW